MRTIRINQLCALIYPYVCFTPFSPSDIMMDLNNPISII